MSFLEKKFLKNRDKLLRKINDFLVNYLAFGLYLCNLTATLPEAVFKIVPASSALALSTFWPLTDTIKSPFAILPSTSAGPPFNWNKFRFHNSIQNKWRLDNVPLRQHKRPFRSCGRRCSGPNLCPASSRTRRRWSDIRFFLDERQLISFLAVSVLAPVAPYCRSRLSTRFRSHRGFGRQVATCCLSRRSRWRIFLLSQFHPSEKNYYRLFFA